MNVDRQQIYLITDELRGLATLAARFAADPYERERADHLRELAARLAATIDPTPYEVLEPIFTDAAWAKVSPIIGAEALTLDADGRVLLCRRRDSGLWCLPGGVCEVGQSPSDAALRELWEEAGLRGSAGRLLGVYDNRRWGGTSREQVVAIVYLVENVAGVAGPGTEMLETTWADPAALPELHPGHDQRVPHLLELVASGRTHHDPASTLTGELPMHQRPDATAP